MRSLFKTEEIIEEILIRFPSARDDNFSLIYEFYMEISPLLLEKTFKEILLNHQMYSLPSFESPESFWTRIPFIGIADIESL